MECANLGLHTPAWQRESSKRFALVNSNLRDFVKDDYPECATALLRGNAVCALRSTVVARKSRYHILLLLLQLVHVHPPIVFPHLDFRDGVDFP